MSKTIDSRQHAEAQVARERALQREIVPLVERSLPGVEVLAVELLSPGRICVYVDSRDGVDFALCERVTHLLDVYRAEYAIDVSSPGPNRPLRRPGHFRLAVGQRVSVRTLDGGKKRVRGELAAADERGVTVVTDTETLEIPYDQIVRGNLIEEE